MFDPFRLSQDRRGPDTNRVIVAELTGEARRHAQWRPFTAEEEAAAVTELRALSVGRADLLAEVAGILQGTSEGELDEPIARSAARLCRQAGADPKAGPIRRRSRPGSRRAAAARRTPDARRSPVRDEGLLVLPRRCYGASARSARARRTYGRIMKTSRDASRVLEGYAKIALRRLWPKASLCHQRVS